MMWKNNKSFFGNSLVVVAVPLSGLGRFFYLGKE